MRILKAAQAGACLRIWDSANGVLADLLRTHRRVGSGLSLSSTTRIQSRIALEIRLQRLLIPFQPVNFGAHIADHHFQLRRFGLQANKLRAHDLNPAFACQLALTALLIEGRDFLERHTEGLRDPDDLCRLNVLIRENTVRMAATLAIRLGLQQAKTRIEAHRVAGKSCYPCKF